MLLEITVDADVTIEGCHDKFSVHARELMSKAHAVNKKEPKERSANRAKSRGSARLVYLPVATAQPFVTVGPFPTATFLAGERPRSLKSHAQFHPAPANQWSAGPPRVTRLSRPCMSGPHTLLTPRPVETRRAVRGDFSKREKATPQTLLGEMRVAL